jgi:hypothetical protein
MIFRMRPDVPRFYRPSDASVDVTGESNIASQIAFGGANRSRQPFSFSLIVWASDACGAN